MTRQLTPEFAETVHLPLEPFARHQEVTNILAQESMRPDSFNIMVNPGYHISVQGGETIIVNTILPLLGRRALRKIATTIKVMDSLR